MKKRIPLCIIDDHCDLIPFLHACWRRKRIISSNLLLFHIDSHPDLVPPTIAPANATAARFSTSSASVTEYQDNQRLYDLLDGEGGISEFILPLLVNGHIDQILWLHQKWCQQFQDGKRRFYIGDNKDGHAVVTLKESYYYDEGIVYEEYEIENKTSINLLVSTDTHLSFSSLELQENDSRHWILDICLDYFTVSNPFLVHLQQMFSHESSSSSSSSSFEDLILILQTMFQSLRFRQVIENDALEGMREEYSLEQRRREREEFDSLLKELLFSTHVPPLDSSLCTRFISLFEISDLPINFLQFISSLTQSMRILLYQSGRKKHLFFFL